MRCVAYSSVEHLCGVLDTAARQIPWLMLAVGGPVFHPGPGPLTHGALSRYERIRIAIVQIRHMPRQVTGPNGLRSISSRKLRIRPQDSISQCLLMPG